MASTNAILILLVTVVLLPNYSECQEPCPKPQFSHTKEYNTGLKPTGLDTGQVDNICQSTPRDDILIECFTSSTGVITRQWFINGELNVETGCSIASKQGGNFSCVLTNECGNFNIFTLCFPDEMPIINSMVTTPGVIPIGTLSPVCLNVTGTVVQPAMLSCSVQNPERSCSIQNPERSKTYNLTWTENGRSLAKYFNKTEISVNSSGLYECVTRNDCGGDSKETEIEIHPVIKKGSNVSSSNMVDVGQNSCLSQGSLTISCEVVGEPKVRMMWAKNNVILPNESGNKLTVMPSNRDDDYTCTVSNKCSTDSATTTLIRKTAAKVTAAITASSTDVGNGCARSNNDPRLTLANICPQLGETVIISCATSEGSTYVISGPQSSSNPRMSPDNNLVLSNFQRTDSGVYYCTAKSACAMANDTINIINLDVPPTIPTQRPRDPPTPAPGNNGSISAGDDICLQTNQSVNISCLPIGNVTTYNWTRNGVFFSNMQNLTEVSFGTYMCRASNPSGTSDPAITRVLPIISVTLGASSNSGNRCGRLRRRPPIGTDFCSFVGDRVMLECNSSPPGLETNIFSDGEASVKVFNSIKTTDESSYFCNTTTECGTPSDMLLIRVYDPARINKAKPLPVPERGELVQGAGRSSEPLCGRDGNKISLHCCYSGVDQPTTMWYFVHPNGTETPVDTNDPAINITDNSMDSILTINPFSQRYIGKYRCNTTNIAGLDFGDVNIIHKSQEDKEWLKGRWGRCSPDCHRGTRNRTVTCVTVSSRIEMDDSGCPSPKPAEEERCFQRGPCSSWVPEAWSQCSKSCGIGFRLRVVNCRTTYSNELLPRSECPDGRPPAFDYCNIQPCACVEPSFCKQIVGTEMCWIPSLQTMCCCTCGA